MPHGPIRIRTRSTRSAFMVVLLLAGTPLLLHGQHVPGPAGMDWEQARRDYNISILREYSTVINAWQGTLDTGDAQAALSYYSADATLVFPDGPPAAGRDAVAAVLRSWWPRLLELRPGLTDFLASDHVAYAAGPVSLAWRDTPDGAVRTAMGHHVTVLVREGRRWRIRAQVLTLPTAERDGS